MAAGGPGDHPLSDIVFHRLEVFGEPIDGLVRRLASRPGWPTVRDEVASILELCDLYSRLGDDKPGALATARQALEAVQARLGG